MLRGIVAADPVLSGTLECNGGAVHFKDPARRHRRQHRRWKYRILGTRPDPDSHRRQYRWPA
jgi:hypothetical protein